MSSRSDVAIRVEGVSKRYRIGMKETAPTSLVGAVTEWVRAPARNLRELRSLSRFADDDADDVLWALRDVNFEVKRGEVLGLIGRNGAGKSTLLKILSRITKPTTGRVEMVGRVASLLEVGTGFSDELTGRENVYLNGTILGMTKAEIDRKFDEIVEFSGVEKFMDTPVKRYSSGMRVRLAFAVAAHLEPEILLVDEVLAVGDAVFQKKCLGKMNEVASHGRTIIFVSHSMNAVNRLCHDALVLQGGTVVNKGAVADMIGFYESQMSTEFTPDLAKAREDAAAVWLRDIALVDHEGLQITGDIDVRRPFSIKMDFEITAELPDLFATMCILDSSMSTVLFSDCGDTDTMPDFKTLGPHTVTVPIPAPLFSPGKYYITLHFSRRSAGILDGYDQVLTFTVVDLTGIRESRPGAIYQPLQWLD